MDKADIVRAVYQRKKTAVTMKDLSVILDELFAVIHDSLESGEKVDIAGFGAFDLKDAATKSLVRFAGSNVRKKSKA